MDGRERIKEASAAHDELVYGVASALSRKAKAAAEMGMMPLAEELWALADTVKAQAERLHQCWSDEFNAWCESVQQGSANLIRGVLAGCELGARES